MGFFKEKYGRIRWKRIFLLIILILLAAAVYSIMKAGGIVPAAKNTVEFVKSGQYKELSVSGAKDFLLEGSGFLRNLLITIIVIAPLLVQGWLSPVDKSTTLMFGLLLGILFYSVAGVVPIKEAFYIAWVINIFLLLYITKGIKENALKPSAAVMIFGVTSYIIAPFDSMITSGKPTQFWPILTLGTIIIVWLFQFLFPKKWEKVSSFFSSFIKFENNVEKEGDEVDKEIKDVERETAAISDVDKDVEKIETALAHGGETAQISQKTQNQLQTAANIQPVETAKHEILVKVVIEQQRLQEQSTNRVRDMLKNEEKYRTTEVGRAQAYVYELGRRILQEMTSKSSNWEEFERLKAGKFSEVAGKLNATRNKRLQKYAAMLEKNAERMGIKTFVGLCTRMIKEINKDRESFGEIVEKEAKNLEKSAAEVKQIAEGITAEDERLAEQKETLRRYDVKVREFYSEIKEQITKINAVEIAVEEKKRIVGELKTKLNWILSYLPQKKIILAELHKNIAEIEKLLRESGRYINKNGRAMKKIEEVNKDIGAELIPEPAV